MMKRTALLTATTLAASTLLSAAQPVASATSNAPFTLHGTEVDTVGTPTWPVMEGDEIVSGPKPVTLNFKDGSRLMLQKNSKAKVTAVKGAVVLDMIAGAVLVATLTSKSKVVVASQSQPIAATQGQVIPATPATPVDTTPAPASKITKSVVPTQPSGAVSAMRTAAVNPVAKAQVNTKPAASAR